LDNGGANCTCRGGIPLDEAGSVIDLAEGYALWCALLRNGKVICKGRNDHGQLGNGSYVSDKEVPAPVDGLKDVVSLAVGWDPVCAAKRNGKVVCWGNRRLITDTASLTSTSRKIKSAPSVRNRSPSIRADSEQASVPSS
jgi:alpha-tubulin suppressor-like RCC1 family protein